MAKKPETFTPEEPNVEETTGYTPETGMDMGAAAPTEMEMQGFDSDFDLDSEYKEEPLIMQGSYLGNVTSVVVDREKYAIIWNITLADNGGVLSDGETPVDGATINYSNWLPKPGDENVMTASGRSSKRQSKINSLKRFSEANGLDMGKPERIIEHIQNGDWIGLQVQVTIGLRTWEGRVFNECKEMKVQR
jgi:hypothetical protein